MRMQDVVLPHDRVVLDHPFAESAVPGRVTIGADEDDAGTGQLGPLVARNLGSGVCREAG